MTAMLATTNIFDISKESTVPQYDPTSSKYTQTCKEIQEHLKSVGSSEYERLSKNITNEILGLKQPTFSNMIDIFHQSPYDSFNEYTNKTSLSHLRQSHTNLYSQCLDYHHCFTKDICKPLKDYKPDNTQLFQQNMEKIILSLSEAFSNSKNAAIKIMDNSSIQTDFIVNVTSPASIQDQGDQGEDSDSDSDDSDDEDEDEDVGYNSNYGLNDNKPTTHSHNNFTERQPKHYHNNFDGASMKSTPTNYNNFDNITPQNVSKSSPFDHWDSWRLPHDQGIDHIMRQAMFDKLQFPTPYASKSNIMFMDGDNVKTFTSDYMLPKLEPQYTSLFRHYNTVNSIRSMVENLSEQITNLLVISYHIVKNCIQLFCYIYDNGNIYGSRIFSKDFFDTIPGFFPRLKTHHFQTMKAEVQQFLSITNKKVTFDNDETYIKFQEAINRRNINDLKSGPPKLDKAISNKLRQSVVAWNRIHPRSLQDFNYITKVFIKHDINNQYFKTSSNYPLFYNLLMQCRIPSDAIYEFWTRFTEPHNNYYFDQRRCKIECKPSVSLNKVMSIQKENSRLKHLLAMEQQKNGRLMEEVSSCNKENEELKQQLSVRMSESESYKCGNIMEHKCDGKSETADSRLSFPSLNQGSDQSLVSADSGMNNYNTLDVPKPAPIDQRSKSFGSWNSGCEAERVCDQSSSSESLVGNDNHDNNTLPTIPHPQATPLQIETSVSILSFNKSWDDGCEAGRVCDESSSSASLPGYDNDASCLMPRPGQIPLQRSLSFKSWDSGCNGVAQSQQSTTPPPHLSQLEKDINNNAETAKLYIDEELEKESKEVMEDEDHTTDKSNLDDSIYDDDPVIIVPAPPPTTEAMPNPFPNDPNLNLNFLPSIFGIDDNVSTHESFVALSKNSTMFSNRLGSCLLNNRLIMNAVYVWIMQKSYSSYQAIIVLYILYCLCQVKSKF